MKVRVQDRQTLLDIALQESGSVEGLIDLVWKNNISLTEEVELGTVLTSPEVVNKSVWNVYIQKNIIPTTGITMGDRSVLFEGINYMGIEIDFIVS